MPAPAIRKPIIHGRDHACGGADPIPGICDLQDTGSPGYPAAVLDVPCDLLGYWRLGEDSGSTFADSNPDLSALNFTKVVNGTAPLTYNIDGALDPTQDDGAVRFNGFDEVAAGGGPEGDYLTVTHAGRYAFATTSSPYSVSLWIRPRTHAGSSYIAAGIVGTWVAGVLNEAGWGITCSWPSGTIAFERRADGALSATSVSTTVPFDVWTFIVASYDGTALRIYKDGALAATTTATVACGGSALEVGRHTTFSPAGGTGHFYYYGDVDELSIFGCAIGADSISTLYEAGTNPYLAGYVLTVQPDGSYAWSLPTVEVTF
jgi:hypothetical protein